jgi:hypothetical protein
MQVIAPDARALTVVGRPGINSNEQSSSCIRLKAMPACRRATKTTFETKRVREAARLPTSG